MDASVPVVSLARESGQRQFPAAIIEQFGKSLKDYGFVTVTDHGFNAGLLDAAYEVADKVFDHPDIVLQRYANANDQNMGYLKFGFERPMGSQYADLKSSWHIRRRNRDDNVFPDDLASDFKTVMLDLFDALDRFGFTLAQLFDGYLGKPRGTFHEMIENGLSLLRVANYPDLDEIQGYGWWKLEDGQEPGGEHGDINLFTILPAATKAGLEIKRRDGEWMAVNNPPSAMIINVGDMLESYTGGYLHSTPHRVTGKKRKGKRFSLPFFVHPREEVVLYEKHGEPVTAGQDLAQRLRTIYGHKAA